MAIPDTTAIETRIRDFWEEILGGEAGADADFFALGGDSMAATLTILAIEESFGVKAPSALVYEHPRAADLAAQVRKRIQDGAAG